MNDAKVQTRGLARRQAILDAATALFLEKGFECTSLSEIVARSKGSRSTLYEHFGNKEGLLRAMVEEVTNQVWRTIREGDGEDPLDEDSLVALGLGFCKAALDGRAIAVCRILATEGGRVPGIVALFFEQGPKVIERRLSNRFAAACRHDGLRDLSPDHLGQVFLGAVMGVIHTRRMLGLIDHPGEGEIETHVRGAVRIFLDGIRPAGDARPCPSPAA